MRVEIDPQQYADVYFPSIFHRLFEEQKFGKQSFVFVPGLQHYVELQTPVITIKSNFWLIQTELAKALLNRNGFCTRKKFGFLQC